jgi:predicted Fe-Mo cluster-binding NifX family protein
MKLAITSQGTDLDAPVDKRFGRAAHILVVDTESLDFEVLDNGENRNAFKGAGINAAVMISRKGVDVLITGYCGPNAFKTLSAAKIQVSNDARGTVRETMGAYTEGRCQFLESANVDGHW